MKDVERMQVYNTFSIAKMWENMIKQQAGMAKLGKYCIDSYGLIRFYRFNYSIAVSSTNPIMPISFFKFITTFVTNVYLI